MENVRRREVYRKIIESSVVDSSDYKEVAEPDGKMRKVRAHRIVKKDDNDFNKKEANTAANTAMNKPAFESFDREAFKARYKEIAKGILFSEDLMATQKAAAEKVKKANIMAKATLQADKIKDQANKLAKSN